MSKDKLPGWKTLPIGGAILEAGNTEKKETGSWRVMVPVRNYEKCIHCLRCWIFCPDDSVVVKDGKVVGTNLQYCKGCGICAKECPPKVACIEMKLESELGPNDPKG